MNNANSNATNTTTASTDASVNVADTLRSQLSDLEAQRATLEGQTATVRAQLSALDSVDAAKAAGNAAGKRNVAKTVGKYSMYTAIAGGLALGGVYAYRAWREARG